MADVPPSLGARLWDESTQGSDHTMAPGTLPLITGGPNGVVYGRLGSKCIDETGTEWTKTTDETVNTGWAEVVYD